MLPAFFLGTMGTKHMIPAQLMMIMMEGFGVQQSWMNLVPLLMETGVIVQSQMNAIKLKIHLLDFHSQVKLLAIMEKSVHTILN